MSDLATDDHVEEVRVAMALNGGVSLAVWMGGCGVELDAARRAHLAPERPLYNALCEAFKRVLVIDLMSGASAGGINGALLGAAIRKQRCLYPTFIRDKWLALGDFRDLLHETSNIAPASLMQGEAFAAKLQETFEALLDSAETDPKADATPEAVDVKLDITTTNIVGEQVTFLDTWGEPLHAREYRALFQFRKTRDFSATALAHASRSSASFPVAFEPFRVDGEALRLAGFERPRWVVDGGLLNNAPISAAIELIPKRAADRQVHRYVMYLNADPTLSTEPGVDAPTLFGVAGSAVNLPRQAPFVDQLQAIKRVTQRASRTFEDPGSALLRVNDREIRAVARRLLPAYCDRRLLQSLEDLTGDPASAREAFDEHGDRVRFPWIPESLDPSQTPDEPWQWGVHAAVRTLYLLIDVLRLALLSAPFDKRKPLFTARSTVYAEIAAIENAYASELAKHTGDHPLRQAILSVPVIEPRAPIERAVLAVLDVRGQLDPELAEGLFDWGDDPQEAFLRRALAVEVVRRSLHDEERVETAQELSFAQLTPYAPGWLFTAEPSDTDRGWCSPEDKVLGLGLAHFAGFYRRSWRANDFMWGRLDAAARIVDMLVSPARSEQLNREGWCEQPAAILAAALLPAKDPDGLSKQLVVEALSSLPAEHPFHGQDETSLAAAIQYDLEAAPKPGLLTRILCTRAAQLEVFRDELGVLQAESVEDARRGGGTPALGFTDDVKVALESLRGNVPSLPKRLRAHDEAGSSLALQTAAQAGLVALGALRTAGRAGQPLFAARALLLPIAGAVAVKWHTRAAVAFGFWAAALFLAGRALQTNGKASFDTPWTESLVVTLFALLFVAGVVSVPALRAALAKEKVTAKGSVLAKRRTRNSRWAAGLALLGAGSLLLAFVGHGWSVPAIVAAPEADEVNGWVLATMIAVVLGAPIVGLSKVLSEWAEGKLAAPWGGKYALAIMCLAAGAVGVLSSVWVWEALGESWWQTAGALLAFASGPVLGYRLLVLRGH